MGRGHNAASVTAAIERNGGRLLKGSFLPEEIPTHYTLVTTQREVNKEKVIASIATAFRRNWDILSVEYVIHADTHKETPNKDAFRLDLARLKDSSSSTILHANIQCTTELAKSVSGLCCLKRKKKEESSMPQKKTRKQKK